MNRKNVGIVRQIDKNGRITLPSEFRKELGVELEDDVEICLVMGEEDFRDSENPNKPIYRKVIEIKKKEER